MFAAVIAHADETSFLVRCVDHHLDVGFDHVFVSLQRPLPDADADVVRRWAGDSRVRIERYETYADDAFRFFTAAKDVVVDWVDPEWVAFIDSDEFWLPQGRSIGDTQGLNDAQLVVVPRYFAPVVQGADGELAETPFPDLYQAIVEVDVERPPRRCWCGRRSSNW